MNEKPRIVITKTRPATSGQRAFPFSIQDVPVEGPLATYRNHAWKVFTEIPFPTGAEEAWKRSDLKSLPAESFRIPNKVQEFRNDNVLTNLPYSLKGQQIAGKINVFSERSDLIIDPNLVDQGVVFSDLRSAIQDHPELVEKLAGSTVRPEDGKFAALTASLAINGILLYVPKGVTIERPLNSMIWTPDEKSAYFSHVLIWLDQGASATYFQESASPDGIGTSMHAGIVEITLSKDSSLRFVELQSFGNQMWNFNHERIQIGENANLDWIIGAVGSHFTKSFSEIDLTESGAKGRMSGFFFTDGEQHLDLDTQQNHRAPNTTSDLLYKGALKGNSRSVWQGMIYVAPGADKTDGYQANRNLILSSHARADSIPGLEILADDVRCTHGATVGKLDEEAMFYAKSRGIRQQEAEKMMVEGFFEPIMQRIPMESVKTHFQNIIQEKMAD